MDIHEKSDNLPKLLLNNVKSILQKKEIWLINKGMKIYRFELVFEPIFMPEWSKYKLTFVIGS